MTRLLAHPWRYIAAAFATSVVLRAAGRALNH